METAFTYFAVVGRDLHTNYNESLHSEVAMFASKVK